MKFTNAAKIFLGILICFAVSCKKHHDDKKANCRLKTYSEERTGSTTTVQFVYNNDGKVASISTTILGDVAIKEFTYTGNTVLSISKTSGMFNVRDSITLDLKGRPENIRRYYNEAGTTWENTALEYNGDELSKIHRSNNLSSTPQTRIVTYANGNPVSIQSTTNTATYEYFPDKTQVADYLNMSGMIDYGFGLYPHQNLMKNLSSGGSTTTVVYEKNADGLIVKANAIAAGTELKLSYQYECN